MTDIQTLFHAPELLNDAELRQMRRKISMQGKLKWGVGLTTAGLAAGFDLMYYRTLSHSHFKVFAAGCLGIYIGSLASQQLRSSLVEDKIDPDILEAHQNR